MMSKGDIDVRLSPMFRRPTSENHSASSGGDEGEVMPCDRVHTCAKFVLQDVAERAVVISMLASGVFLTSYNG